MISFCHILPTNYQDRMGYRVLECDIEWDAERDIIECHIEWDTLHIYIYVCFQCDIMI